MKWFFIILISTSSFILAGASALAQKIEGTVVDSATREALPFTTFITKDVDEKILGGTIADADGKFELDITTQTNKVEVTHLGYHPFIIKPPFYSNNTLNVELNLNEELLSEVVVQGERTSREFLIDRKIINFGIDLQASGGTVLEAFEQLPEVETDPISNDVKLRGSANVRILIDGKPSPLNNADLLAQINASHVERVEIITAPSAKFQADGQSGIINIVLKDKVIKGLAGSIDLDGRTNPRYGSGINLTFGLGELNIQGGASYRNSFSVNKRTVYREFQMNGNSQNVSAISEFSGDVSNINIKADWFLNTTNDLSLSYRWTNNEHFITPVTHIYNENSGIVVNRLHNYHQHLSRSYNVNYRKRFDSKKQRFVDFDITLNQNQNTLPSKAEVDDTVVLDNELFYDNYILNTALDFTWDIDHKLSVEAGSLYTRKFIDNNQLRRSLEGSRELAYTYNEHNYASYILLKKGWEKIGLQLGIRSEYFQSDGLINNEVNAIDREFFNLFPSAHFSYKRSESLSYSLSYNRRIGRPSFYELNPLTTINNPLYRREGNPNLTPEFTNNIELGVNWNKSKFSLNSSLYYRRTKDIINRLFDVDENGNTIMIFSNGGQIQTIGLENTISNSLNDKLDHSITITGYYQYAEPELKDFYYRNQYNYSLRSKISYKASNKFSGDIQWNYFGNRRSLNIKSDDRGYLNLAARYKTLHNKGTVTLRFTDIFRTNIYESTRRSNNIYEEIMWRGQTRVLVLAFNYRFSKGDITLRKNPSKSYSETGALE